MIHRKRGGFEEEKREQMKWNAAQQKKIMDSVRGWHEPNSDPSNRISELLIINIVFPISNVPILATLRLKQKYRERKNETNTSNEVILELFTEKIQFKFQYKSFN